MITCVACGAEWPDTLKFCGECAAPLQGGRPVAQERKVVTSLFCDLVGFTAMSEAADPEDVDAILGRYFTAARSAIEAFGGTVEKFIGDAVVGVFGVPAAHEDDPERAVRAGLRIVEAVEGLTRPDGSPLQLRVGVNTGEALVRLDVTPGSGEGFLTGDAVNTAARIQSVAPLMGVAVGRSTFEATKPVFDYLELEPALVKGKTEPVEVWQAIAPLARFGTDITRRHDSPLVGREIDVAVLKGVFDKTVAASSPQLVTIVGEPGLGKSRLVAELFGYTDSLPRLITWRQGRCLPYGEGITFWALSEIVKAHTGILDTDTAEVALDKLEVVLPEGEQRVWLRQRLLPLLGMETSSQAEQGELFTAWRTFLESVAEQGPTVLVFEDLHWADPALLAFLEHLADRADAVPLLIVATTRPDLYDNHPDYGRGLRNTTTINLAPLTPDETTRLALALLEVVAVPEELREPLVDRAGGNPLFIEEYVRLLQDRDLIERLDGRVRLRKGDDLPLPDSVQALIAARLDTLTAESKAMLADAAVVGKVFWAGAVAAMGDRDESAVRDAMRELSRSGIVRPMRRPSMARQTEYAFGHALARDVAYEQLPRASRAGRHVAAARWIEAQAGERVEDVADVLAHHYSTALALAQASSDTDLAEQVQPAAVRFLLLAGERATGLDPESALTYFRQAATLTPTTEPLRSRVLAGYGLAALYAGQSVEAQPVLEEAIDLFSAVGDVPAAVEALTTLQGVLSRRGDPGWLATHDQMQALVQDLTTGPVHVQVSSRIAIRNWLQGEHVAALDEANAALDLADRLGLDRSAVAVLDALSSRAAARCDLGDLGGLADFEEAISVAAAAGYARRAGIYYNNLATVITSLRGPAAAVQVYEQGIAFCDTHGQRYLGLTNAVGRLEPLVSMGQLDEVLHTAEQISASLESDDNQQDLLDVRANQARALYLKGRPERSTEWLDWLAASSRGSGAGRELEAMALGAAALTRAGLGHHDVALRLFAELAENRHIGNTYYAASQLASWIRALVALDDLALAEQLAANRPNTPYGQHAGVAAQALLSEAHGDHRTALSAHTDAADRWHDFTAYVEQSFALLGQGRCLLALLRHDEAVPVLQQARDMFSTMGAQPALTETETLLSNVT